MSTHPKIIIICILLQVRFQDSLLGALKEKERKKKFETQELPCYRRLVLFRKNQRRFSRVESIRSEVGRSNPKLPGTELGGREEETKKGKAAGRKARAMPANPG